MDFQLTAEQKEFRDTVRDFVRAEIKPVVHHPDRLQDFARPFPRELLDAAARMGLRTLALSEDAGGAGADRVACCIVMEELGAGDPGIAATLAHTSLLGRAIFEALPAGTVRDRLLDRFLSDEAFHLAYAAGRSEADAEGQWRYHRPRAPAGCSIAAVRCGDGWRIDGVSDAVANAPLAGLIAVRAGLDARTGESAIILVPRDAPGLTVEAIDQTPARGSSGVNWFHGTSGRTVFSDCRVSPEHVLPPDAAFGLTCDDSVLHGGLLQSCAINIGIGRAAYEAAIAYAGLRRQGGRHIVEHQAIAAFIADMAIRLEAARNLVWRAAWTADHPDARGDLETPDMPLEALAKVFVSEAMHEVTERAAECFGAMGVMLDMPLARHVHDALRHIHAGVSNAVARFRVAEAAVGYSASDAAKRAS